MPAPTPRDLFGSRGPRPQEQLFVDPDRPAPRNPNATGLEPTHDGTHGVVHYRRGRIHPNMRVVHRAPGYGTEEHAIYVGLVIRALALDEGTLKDDAGDARTLPRPVLRGPSTARRRYDIAFDPRQPGAGGDDLPCRDVDPDLFFPDGRGGHRVPTEVQRACAACPVRARCLEWAIANGEFGYWAGTTEARRKTIAARRRLDERANEE